MFLHIVKARYLNDYKVEVAFNDGRSGIVDLANALKGPMFEPLKDLDLFSRLKVDEDLDTIVWPNGADFAPEFIYFLTFKNDTSLKEQFTRWGYIS